MVRYQVAKESWPRYSSALMMKSLEGAAPPIMRALSLGPHTLVSVPHALVATYAPVSTTHFAADSTTRPCQYHMLYRTIRSCQYHTLSCWQHHTLMSVPHTLMSVPHIVSLVAAPDADVSTSRPTRRRGVGQGLWHLRISNLRIRDVKSGAKRANSW